MQFEFILFYLLNHDAQKLFDHAENKRNGSKYTV